MLSFGASFPRLIAGLPMILLKDFVTSGTIADVRIGSKRPQVAQQLGRPIAWEGPSIVESECWFYGDFKFHFRDQTLVKIIASNFADRPQCGKDNKSDSWILTRSLTPNDLTQNLKNEKVEFCKRCETRHPWHVDITTDSGTCLRFVPRDDDLNDHRLLALWQDSQI